MLRLKAKGQPEKVKGQGFISLETPTSRDRSKKVNSLIGALQSMHCFGKKISKCLRLTEGEKKIYA